MILTLFLIPLTLAVGIELTRYALTRHRDQAARRRLWVGLLCNATPVAVLLLSLCFDNSPTIMRLIMWAIWSWLFLVVPRLFYILCSALRWPRVGTALAVIIASTLLYGVIFGRRALVVNEVEICSQSLPKAFDGYRIAHFTDLHLGTLVHTRGEVRRVVERINAAHPDLVCFTGDLVNIRHSELDSTAMALLQQIEAPVVSILGNHDIGSYIRDTVRLSPEESTRRLIAQEEAMGWCLLQDSTRYLYRGGDSISLTGISFERRLRHDRHNRQLPLTAADKAYRGVPDSLFNLTLVHVPQLWDPIRTLGYGDLTLSGHVHAMQLKALGWSPAQWLFERWSGRYDEEGSTLYINDGIGYVGYPMRLNAAPELTIYTLKLCE